MPRMSELRIRIKIGEHEIELEGSADAVERQFEPFRQLLIPAVETPSAQMRAEAQPPPPLPLEKIVRGRGTIYSLTVDANLEDAILIILLAQRSFVGTKRSVALKSCLVCAIPDSVSVASTQF